jgi:hypothetical protein
MIIVSNWDTIFKNGGNIILLGICCMTMLNAVLQLICYSYFSVYPIIVVTMQNT